MALISLCIFVIYWTQLLCGELNVCHHNHLTIITKRQSRTNQPTNDKTISHSYYMRNLRIANLVRKDDAAADCFCCCYCCCCCWWCCCWFLTISCLDTMSARHVVILVYFIVVRKYLLLLILCCCFPRSVHTGGLP